MPTHVEISAAYSIHMWKLVRHIVCCLMEHFLDRLVGALE